MIKEMIKELLREELTSTKKEVKTESLANKFIGQRCLFRTRSAGVHFGTLVAKNGQECLVKDARRIWYWASACSLSQLAMEGDKDLSSCKIAIPVNEIVLDEVIETIPMTDQADKILTGAPEWKK